MPATIAAKSILQASVLADTAKTRRHESLHRFSEDARQHHCVAAIVIAAFITAEHRDEFNVKTP